MPSQLRNGAPAEVISSASSTIGSPARFYYRQNERKNKQGQMELLVTPPPAFFLLYFTRPSVPSACAAHFSHHAAPLMALNRPETSYLLAYLHYSSFFTPFISSSTLPRRPCSYMRFLPFKGRLQLMCETSCSRRLVLCRLWLDWQVQ